MSIFLPVTESLPITVFSRRFLIEYVKSEGTLPLGILIWTQVMTHHPHFVCFNFLALIIFNFVSANN
jgi:hypothetical protein